ncbi:MULTISPECIES: hypothetical protein [Pontibacter]|nr:MULTISPECIES: hypothetical protein [Pontibacter]
MKFLIVIVGLWFEPARFEIDRGDSSQGTGKPALFVVSNYS